MCGCCTSAMRTFIISVSTFTRLRLCMLQAVEPVKDRLPVVTEEVGTPGSAVCVRVGMYPWGWRVSHVLTMRCGDVWRRRWATRGCTGGLPTRSRWRSSEKFPGSVPFLGSTACLYQPSSNPIMSTHVYMYGCERGAGQSMIARVGCNQ